MILFVCHFRWICMIYHLSSGSRFASLSSYERATRLFFLVKLVRPSRLLRIKALHDLSYSVHPRSPEPIAFTFFVHQLRRRASLPTFTHRVASWQGAIHPASVQLLSLVLLYVMMLHAITCRLSL